MQCVYTTPLSAEAYLLKGWLESEGIVATIQGEDHPTPDVLPSVWVATQDYERAEALVRDFLHAHQAAPVGTPWQCPACGETLDPQFTDCWQCGASRPAEDAATAPDS
ncbi:MAG: DUF2007 domain-containing protein [Chloroflexales bacterium]